MGGNARFVKDSNGKVAGTLHKINSKYDFTAGKRMYSPRGGTELNFTRKGNVSSRAAKATSGAKTAAKATKTTTKASKATKTTK